MRILKIVAFCAVFSFGQESDKDCVKFNTEPPEFSEKEWALIERYLPQIASFQPKSLINHYLSFIQKYKDGYTFHFSNLIALTSHECLESGLITMAMDGSHSFVVDEKKKTMTWDPGESPEKPVQIKLK
jgi:hypothetical protein